MRDIGRIGKVLERLEALWYAHPDLRLAQIIGNAYPHFGHDPYYIEDLEFIQQLEDTHNY